MGDEVLMKKTVMGLVVAGVLFANTDTPNQSLDEKANLIKEYQEMFQRISQKRVGLDDIEIAKVKPPFLKIVKKKKGTDSATKSTKATVNLVLEAILGKKVMINGSWYSLYQKVSGMKIVSIKGDTVWLQGATSKQKLTIRKKNANITIK